MTTATKKPTAKKPTAKKTAYKKPTGEKSNTQLIIELIEERLSSGAFELRWGAFPTNLITGKRYKGINAIMLGLAQEENPNIKSNIWATYKQAESKGLQVVKGAKSTHIIKYVEVNNKNKDEDDNTESDYKKLIPIAAAVFNISLMDGYEHVDGKTTETFDEILSNITSVMEQTGVSLANGGNRAYFSPTKNHIQMPHLHDFIGDKEQKESLYLTTLTHELAHSTGSILRPNLQSSMNRDVEYAKEEVIAELTSAMLCATLGIKKKVLESHAGYIRGWLELAKTDNKNYFTTACALATTAHDYIMSFIDSSYNQSEAIEEAKKINSRQQKYTESTKKHQAA